MTTVGIHSRTQVFPASTTSLAAVEQTDISAWGIMRVLHTFTGVRRGDQRNDRDRVLTTVWALSVDAIAAENRTERASGWKWGN